MLYEATQKQSQSQRQRKNSLESGTILRVRLDIAISLAGPALVGGLNEWAKYTCQWASTPFGLLSWSMLCVSLLLHLSYCI